MMNHSVRQTRIRRLKRWRDEWLERIAILMFVVVVLFCMVYLPLKGSGW